MQRMVAAAAGFVVVAGLGVSAYFAFAPAGDRFAQCEGTAVAGAEIGGPFELVTHLGAPVTDADVIDRPTLMYFGYTHCPDVCPLDAVRNADAVDLLAESGHDVKPVFVTIDPERDTPEVMAEFMDLVHDDYVGLTGDPENIRATARAYRVVAQKNGDGADYLMDHTTFTYLMAPKEGLLTFFRRSTTAEEMSQTTACMIDAMS